MGLPPWLLAQAPAEATPTEDHNFGTILRTTSNEEFTESNAIFVLRAQAYAIEIARLRNGLNDWVYPVLLALVIHR